MSAARWHVYLIRCGDGALYTGITTDVARRVEEHRRGGGRGAKRLRGRAPLRLVATRLVGGRGPALVAECRIKKLSKARKEELVRLPRALTAMVATVRGAKARGATVRGARVSGRKDAAGRRARPRPAP